MKRLFHKLVWLLTIIGILGCGLITPRGNNPSSNAEETQTDTNSTKEYVPLLTEDFTGVPTLENLSEGWSQIKPGGNTSCARGGEYSFFVRKADTDKLLIYFEGGGSCYDAQTCREGGNYFDDSIDPAYEADNPELKSSGLFDLANIQNPFKDYNIVFVSYCTGDAFLGHKTVEYKYNGTKYKINHVGFTNTQRVLGWTYQNFPNPSTISVIGCSAGVIGSYFNSPYIIEKYKGIPYFQLGDSGGGYLDGPAAFVEPVGMKDLLPNWLPQYQNLISNGLVHSKYFFSIPSQAYPTARFGFLDTQEDEAQAEIIARFNPNLTLAKVIQSNLADIRSDAPGFYSYTGPGNYHCITMNPVFYDYETNGIKLSDWLSAFSTGGPVENVSP